MSRAERVVAWAGVTALVVVLARHGVAIAHQLGRAPDFDETEYLHASWLLANGLRVYRDFLDNHTPLFFAALRAFVPRDLAPESALDVFVRARIAAAICGTGAALCAATLAYRIARHVSAPVIVVACLTGAQWTWQRAIADVRADPPALLLFWLGALLVLGGPAESLRAALRAGLGLGLVGLAAVLNPKWPLESLALAGAYAWTVAPVARARPRGILYSLVTALVLAAGGLAITLPLGSLSDVLTCNVRLTRFLAASFTRAVAADNPRFLHDPPCSRPFRDLWPLVGVAPVLAALAWGRARNARPGIDVCATLAVVGIALGSLVEVRFVYPYPFAWPQYYLMWSFAVAVLYGCAPAALLALAASERLAPTVHSVALLAALILHADAIGTRTPPQMTDGYWFRDAEIARRLGPGDTVWLDAQHHPVGAPDADYYWYGFLDITPGAMRFRAVTPDAPLPLRAEDDLPPCRLERGLEHHLRFVSGAGDLREMPVARACVLRLMAQGRLAPTDVKDVLAVVR